MSQRRFERDAHKRQAAAARRRRRAGLAAGAVGAAVLMAPGVANAATYTVDKAGDGPAAGACDPGIAADCTLRDAVAKANASADADTIDFIAGLPTIELTEGELSLDTGQGDITVAGPGSPVLTISGKDNGRIFDVTGDGVAEISGLTLTNGRTTGSGGAIVSHSELTVTGTVVKNSSAGSDGGGIASYAPLDVVRSIVVDNDSGDAGGGISQRPEVDFTKFAGEDRGLFDECEGLPYPINLFCEYEIGVTVTDPGDLNVEDSSVSQNASGQGGGVYADYQSYKGDQPVGDVTITRTTLNENTAQSGGGGIGLGSFSSENTFDLVDSTVSRNRVEVEQTSEETLTDTELLRRARGAEPLVVPNGTGGGIEFGFFGGEGKVSNSTVSLNSAANGGGIHAGGGGQISRALEQVSPRGEPAPAATSIEVANTTVASNSASRIGGGVSLESDPTPGDNVKLTSTIVGDNAAAGAKSDLSSVEGEPGFDAAHSLLETQAGAQVIDDPARPNVTGQDPQLGGLTGNGGPTQTQLPAQSSPALDKGSNGDALDTDQRQSPFARLIDRPIPNALGGDGTDIGSVEVPPASPAGEPNRPFTPSSTPTVCGRRSISLVRADRRGSKVKLTGLVGAALYGKSVTIQTDPKGAKASAFTKTATVKASKTGAFTATVPAPDKADYATVRYRAKAGSSTSPALKLPQSLTSKSVKSAKGTITVTGKVKKSVLGKRNRVKIRRLVCGRYRTVGSAKPDADGSYRITFKATEIRGVSLYRAEGRVLRKAGSKKYVTQYARAISIKTTSQTG
jgi:hypothetical protein